MNAIEQKTLKFIQENNLIQENDNILVAFSGGPDSVFLLTILHKFSNLLKINLFAAHINHNLRGNESDKDQEFCHSFCSLLGVDCFSESVNVKTFAAENKLSIEESARELRYKAFSEIAEKCNCSKIATAHNIGDNSETMLFNFLKGAGISGLKGIPVRRGNIIRPVLNINKEEIINYLKQEKIDFVIDSSNLESDFKRNFIRNKIIPLIKNEINPSFENALLNSSMILSSAEKIIDRHLDVFIRTFTESSENLISIRTDFFIPENKELFGELIKRIVRQNLESDIVFSDIKTIVALAQNEKGSKNNLSGGLIAVREKNKITISEYYKSDLPEPLVVEPGKSYKVLNYEIALEVFEKGENFKFSTDYEVVDFSKLNGELILRPWNDGDKFRPLGMKGFKKVADFLAEQNVESAGKREKLVLENEGSIIWIAGFRVDDRYKVTNETENILKLRIL